MPKPHLFSSRAKDSKKETQIGKFELSPVKKVGNIRRSS